MWVYVIKPSKKKTTKTIRIPFFKVYGADYLKAYRDELKYIKNAVLDFLSFS